MGDATDREEKALRQLTDRLVGHYGSSHSPELVEEMVGQVRRRFDGHAVRDFVPILVERIVRRELQHTPPQPKADDRSHELDYADAPVVPERVSAPSIEEDAADAAPTEVAPTDAAPAPADDVPAPTDATSAPADAASADDMPAPVDHVPSAVSESATETVAEDAGASEPAPGEADSPRPGDIADIGDTAAESSPADGTGSQQPAPGTDRPASADSGDADPDLPDTDVIESITDQRDSLPAAAAEAAVTPAHSPVEPTQPEIVATTPSASDAAAEPEPERAAATSPASKGAGTAGLVTVLRQPRVLAVAAAVVVLVVVLVVAFGFRGGDSGSPAPAPALITAHGVVGSEKMGFFTDPRVVDALARKGIRLEVDPAGSRQIATSVKLDGDDFAFPSSSLAAERIQRERGITAKYTPFSSPMVVASFRPIVDLLARAGIARPGTVPAFDMRRYLDLTQQGTQWDQLEANTSYPVRKNVLISTTDPRTSNSAAMYLAVAAYVANDDAIVQGPAAENFVLSKVSRLFTKQGYTENSSAGPFGEYLTAGMGPTPMVWGYESQFVEAAVAGKLPADAVMLYPSPTVLSRHTLVPLTATGDRVGQLLSTDPELQRLAAEHGFRTADPSQFSAVTAEHHIPVAPDVVDVVDTPTYDTLEHLLDGVARSYN
ncbi:three-helix bundle dimerization domain-containing protein [Nocardia nova]|uniref:three-helix bundle dimerization domain-containing protein n=1 Tax=Nocardia nova TaxID=37330 RepID=UPI0037978E9F